MDLNHQPLPRNFLTTARTAMHVHSCYVPKTPACDNKQGNFYPNTSFLIGFGGIFVFFIGSTGFSGALTGIISATF